jgi:arylsulfate sulfotransferase
MTSTGSRRQTTQLRCPAGAPWTRGSWCSRIFDQELGFARLNRDLRRHSFFLCSLVIACSLLAEVGCGVRPSSSPGEVNVASRPQSLPTPGTVSATQHPLVASYSILVPAAGQARVEFGTSASYRRATQTHAVPIGGGTVIMLVAGMRAQTTYHMRARVDLSNGTTLLDSDHTFTTGSLPNATFPTVKVTPAGALPTGAGVDMVSGSGTDVTAAVLDTDGSVIWYNYDPTLPASSSASPIRQLSNGDYLINYSGDVREVDLAGDIVREVTLGQVDSELASAGYPFQIANIHHDVIRLDNGHWILLANEAKDFEDLPGYPGTTTVVGDDLIDLDTNNQIVWVWRAFDHLDVNRHPYLFPDWTHSNAIVYTPDGNLLLSVRHQSWILKIDYANGAGGGDVLWRLGPGGDFTLSVSDPAQWFYNQHYPNLLQASGSSQQIAMFDNGDTRPGSTGQPCTTDCYSRAVIMNIDELARTAQISWQYTPGWYSFWGGSIVSLPNGDVEFDSSTVNGGNSRVIEVTPGPSPQIVWQMDSSNAAFYRAYRIPSLYPGVQW